MNAHETEVLSRAFRPLVLTPDTHPHFYTGWEPVSYPRNELITCPGSIERYLYVVLSGVHAIYLIGRNGEKRVIGFAFDGSFSGVYDSFIHGTPSHYHLETLTPTCMLRLSKSGYDSLFEHYPEFNYWGRIAHQELLVGRVQREIELITLDSRERYDLFMQRCPAALRNIPQKYLASYLNMTPETFSRLRASKS